MSLMPIELSNDKSKGSDAEAARTQHDSYLGFQNTKFEIINKQNGNSTIYDGRTVAKIISN